MKRISDDDINRLVFDLQKPARYTGGEFNSIVKEDSLVRMGICYPDLYEIGMSNHGLRILYDIANRVEGAACERVFAVAPDFEEKSRLLGIPLYTLETRTPLCELDLLGFNVSHELLATNILQVLDLGLIPLLRNERTENHPLIMAGGEGISNPAPLMDFADLFYLGDGEEGIVDILEILKEARGRGQGRRETIEDLCRCAGVLAADKVEYVYDDGRLVRIEGDRVRKRVFRGMRPLDPEKPLVPSIRVAQDRAVVEVMRGCKNLCKFCQAGHYELPCREYGVAEAVMIINTIIDNSGYNELTLASLSLSDYRYLTRLLNEVLPGLTERGVSISFPSLRVDRSTLPLIESVSDLRRSSLTFAVESASEELRARAWKRLSNEDLLGIIEHVFGKGWRILKLYFMLGLPGCTDIDEADATIGLLKRITGIARGKKEINVTLSPFVPKPHTPFQWERMMDQAYFEDVVGRIKRGVPRMITVKSHTIRASLLEGVLARGDTRLGGTIHASYLDGCRLDSWGEYFNYDIWEKNLDRHMPGWRTTLDARETGSVLPWEVVRTGFEKLYEARRHKFADLRQSRVPARATDQADATDLSGPLERFARKYKVACRARIRFSKQGFARFIPHIDFMEIVKRSLRMADAPVSFTQGFNKRERVSFGYPAPVGMESRYEFCDTDFHDSVDVQDLSVRLNQYLPQGISVLGARSLDEKGSLMAATCAVEYGIKAGGYGIAAKIETALKNGGSIAVEGKKGIRNLNLGDVVLGWEVHDAGIVLVLSAGDENAVRADTLAYMLGEIPTQERHLLRIEKLRQFSREGMVLKEIV